jgi:hypothetical protein
VLGAALALLLAAAAGPAAATTFRFAATADATARADAPETHYGTDPLLRADGDPVSRAYLRFNVSGLTRSVRKATLRLHARNASGEKGIELRPAGLWWTEAGITYSTAPAPGEVVARTGAYADGATVELDATALVKGNGAVAMAVTTTGTVARWLSSREDGTAAYRPQLVVEERPYLGGAQVHPLWNDTTTADFDRDLDMAKAAGMDTVRMDLGWSTLEHDGKGQYAQYYVDKADTFFDHAAARGLRVIATLWSTPCWASSAPPDVKQDCAGDWWNRNVTAYAPSDPQDYADIAEWVTRRWGSKLHALEIWNEPNHPAFLKAPDQAAAYAGMLKAAYPRIKAARRALLVLGGDLVYSDGAFLTDLYDRLGVKGSFDGLSYHPFTGRDPDDTSTTVGRKYDYQRGTEWLREIMVAHGDKAKQLWITEVGFPTCSAGTHPWCVTPEKQAEYLGDTYRIARQKWPFVRAVMTYNLRNKGTSLDSFENQMGILWRDWSPKPAYGAIRAELTR